MVHLQTFIIAVVLMLVMIASTGCTSIGSGFRQPGPTREPGKPNIVLIVTDDQSMETMIDMPSLNEELIGNGINFTNGFNTTPLCSPSRASLLTGLYAHNHGVFDNRLPNGGAPVFDDSSTIATWLEEAGYRTSFLGKYLNKYDELIPYGYVPPGWEDWQAFIIATKPHRYYYNYELSDNGEIVHYGTEKSDYSADMIADQAERFIRESKNEPFFIIANFYNPHQPHSAAKRHNDMFRDDEKFMSRLRAKPNFNEKDVSDKPGWVQALPPLNGEDIEYNVGVYQRSSRSLLSVDEAVLQVLDTLDDVGQRDNTVVIYMTDNGLTLGEHRLTSQKNCGYEECIRSPFIISYPGLIEAPREDDRLVLNIDLAPTIAQLAGVDIPGGVDGISLVPLLDGSATEWRESALIEHWRLTEGFGSIIPDFFGVRTAKWKYIEYDTGEKELYDLENDPYELDNLAGDNQYESIMHDMAAQLDALRSD